MTTTESQEHSPTPEPVETPAPVPPRPATPPQGDTSPPPAPQNSGTPTEPQGNPFLAAQGVSDGNVVTTDAPVTRSFVKQAKETPAAGVRGMMYKATGGLINTGLSRREIHQRELYQRIAKPISGTRNIVFMCLKGGISKTSNTCGIGLSLAEHRPDSALRSIRTPMPETSQTDSSVTTRWSR